MAIEKNPFDKIPEEIQNVIPIPKKVEDTNATFEVEPDGGDIIKKVASKLEKASKAHAGQAKTLRSIKVRGGGMAVQGMNFKGVY